MRFTLLRMFPPLPIGDRAGRTVQRLNELYATNGQIGYVSTERVDGKVILPEGIKLFKMKP